MRFGLLAAVLWALAMPCEAHAQEPAARQRPSVDRAPLLVLSGPRQAGQAVALGLADVARRDGGALVDLRAKVATPPTAGLELGRAVAAYQEFDYGRSLSHLRAALEEASATGASGLTASELSDLFVYRAMVKHAQGDAAASWDDFVQAATIEPARHLDAVRFSPRIVASFERARNEVASGASTELVVQAPADCSLTVDARPTALGQTKPLRSGNHFLRLVCPGFAAFATVLSLQGERRLLEPNLVPVAEPTLERLLGLATSRGFRHLVWARVAAGDGVAPTCIFELRNARGKSLARTSIAVGKPRETRRTAVVAVGRLLDALAPAPTRDPIAVPGPTPWYEKPWLWAAVGVAASTAVLLPFALRGDSPDGFPVRIPGDTP